MRKNWYKYVICPFMLLFAVNSVNAATTVDIDGISYRITSNSTVSIHDHYSDLPEDSVIILPAEVIHGGIHYSVTSIDPYAFACMNNLRRVEIPSTVTSIGNAAFFSNNALKAVTLPPTLTTIGDSLFMGCRMNSIVIPSSVTSLGDAAFMHCRRLTSLEIPASVTSIGERAFHNCTSLTSITIPSLVTSIKSSTFDHCSSLRRVTLPASLTSIGLIAFYGCANLDSICIPASVTLIQEAAFAGCVGLKQMYMCRESPVVFKSGMFVFDEINRDSCMLFVPSGTKERYAAAEQWKDFGSIVEFSPTVIERPSVNPSTVFYDKYTGTLQFDGSGKNAKVTVYDSKGVVRLSQTSMNSDAILIGLLPKDVYVVNVTTDAGSFRTKVLVQ